MATYTSALYKWHKWTGNGSGVITSLEDWSDNKLEKYNIDLETYNHTNVANHPSLFRDIQINVLPSSLLFICGIRLDTTFYHKDIVHWKLGLASPKWILVICLMVLTAALNQVK